MRNAYFKKLNGEWTSRPFQGCLYKIVRNPDSSYHLTFNDAPLGNGDRIDLLKDLANQHLHDGILRGVKSP
jgi:hypothetical protein